MKKAWLLSGVLVLSALAIAAVVFGFRILLLDDRLNSAARDGDRAAVESLIRQGARVDGRSLHDLTPLMSAAGGGHEAVVSLLLERGADANAHSGSGSPLMWAAAGGHVTVVRMLLAHGARADWRSDSGGTALETARDYHHPAVAEVLRRAGAGS